MRTVNRNSKKVFFKFILLLRLGCPDLCNDVKEMLTATWKYVPVTMTLIANWTIISCERNERLCKMYQLIMSLKKVYIYG